MKKLLALENNKPTDALSDKSYLEIDRYIATSLQSAYKKSLIIVQLVTVFALIIVFFKFLLWFYLGMALLTGVGIAVISSIKDKRYTQQLRQLNIEHLSATTKPYVVLHGRKKGFFTNDDKQLMFVSPDETVSFRFADIEGVYYTTPGSLMAGGYFTIVSKGDVLAHFTLVDDTDDFTNASVSSKRTINETREFTAQLSAGFAKTISNSIGDGKLHSLQIKPSFLGKKVKKLVTIILIEAVIGSIFIAAR